MIQKDTRSIQEWKVTKFSCLVTQRLDPQDGAGPVWGQPSLVSLDTVLRRRSSLRRSRIVRSMRMSFLDLQPGEAGASVTLCAPRPTIRGSTGAMNRDWRRSGGCQQATRSAANFITWQTGLLNMIRRSSCQNCVSTKIGNLMSRLTSGNIWLGLGFPNIKVSSLEWKVTLSLWEKKLARRCMV